MILREGADSARRAVRIVVALLVLAGLGDSSARANGWEHLAIPFEALTRALVSEDAETRVRASISLGIKEDPRAVEPLLAALARPEPAPAARSAIYTALGKIGDARALPALIEALGGEDREELRGDAAAALGAIRAADALPVLLEALPGESFPVRIRIIDALGAFAQPESIAALSRIVSDGKNQTLRRRAIHALGRTGSDAAAEPLLDARARARTDRSRGDIVDALGALGAPVARLSLTRLLEEAEDPDLRLRIVATLGAIRDGSTAPTLIEMLSDDDPGVRFFAVAGLNRIAPQVAAQPLQAFYLTTAARMNGLTPAEAMADPANGLGDLEIARAALRALLAIDAAVGLDAFLDGAQPRIFPRDSALGLKFSESVYELRRLAIIGLGYTKSRTAAAFLAQGPLHDPDPRLRTAAVRSLGVLGQNDAFSAVQPALEDPHPEVRWTVASVLGRLGDKQAVALLVSRLADSHPEVRRQAVLSLGYLGDRSAREAVAMLTRDDDDTKVREAARQTLHLLDGN